MKKLNTNIRNTTNKTLLLAGCLGLGAICAATRSVADIQMPFGYQAAPPSSLDTGTVTNFQHTYDLGNSWAGAYGTFSVGAMNRRQLQRTFNASETGWANASVSAVAGVKLVQQRIEAVNLNFAVNDDNGPTRLGPTNLNCFLFRLPVPARYCSRALSVGGHTVDSGTTSQSCSSSSSHNTTFWSGSATAMVGWVPVTVSGSVGGGYSLNYTLSLPANGAGISAAPSVWTSATASAGVGAFGCGVGLCSKFQLGTLGYNPSVTVTPTTITGQANLSMTPVSIDLDLAAFFFGNEVAGINLARYSAPAASWTVMPNVSLVNKACSH